jgi:hypothetical protein
LTKVPTRLDVLINNATKPCVILLGFNHFYDQAEEPISDLPKQAQIVT